MTTDHSKLTRKLFCFFPGCNWNSGDIVIKEEPPEESDFLYHQIKEDDDDDDDDDDDHEYEAKPDTSTISHTSDQLKIFNERQRGKRRIIPNRLYFDEAFLPLSSRESVSSKVSLTVPKKVKTKINRMEAKSFICSKCSKSFSHHRTLTQHNKFECLMDPRFKCPYCEYRSKWVTNINTHVRRRHTWKKVYAINLMEHLSRRKRRPKPEEPASN